MAIILSFKPEGLFGSKEVERYKMRGLINKDKLILIAFLFTFISFGFYFLIMQ